MRNVQTEDSVTGINVEYKWQREVTKGEMKERNKMAIGTT